MVKKNDKIIILVIAAILIALYFGQTHVAFPDSNAMISYYCSVSGSQIICNLSPDQFYVKGTDALNGVGFNGLSTLFSQLPNAPNMCNVTLSLINGQCNMGSCVEGCGNTGACPVGVAPSVTFQTIGTVSGDTCVYPALNYTNPCCFGEWQAKPPSASGSITFYYQAPTNQTACPQDAMQCPDGSYVSRTGPNCTFPSCPTNNTTVCTPNWYCGDWSTCQGGTQTRSCTDANNCGVANPNSISQSCTPNPTCESLGYLTQPISGDTCTMISTQGLNCYQCVPPAPFPWTTVAIVVVIIVVIVVMLIRKR